MISICIPVYNVAVGRLYNDLLQQCAQLNAGCEIIFIDDASNENIRAINAKTVCNARYIQLEQNMGRAKIRNLFLQYARQPYLLFLDCDAQIMSKAYLATYITALQKNDCDVIGGSSVYAPEQPEKKRRLRWKYGHSKEMKAARMREQQPAKSFMTSNFLIKKNVFEKINFDERISGYGHEDTLFGFALSKAGVKICHIYNPVLNAHLETNKEFIAKTEESIANLVKVLQAVDYDNDFIRAVSLLSFYKKIKPARFFLNISFRILKIPVKRFLEAGFSNLYLFDYYKLGLLEETIRQKKIGRFI